MAIDESNDGIDSTGQAFGFVNQTLNLLRRPLLGPLLLGLILGGVPLGVMLGKWFDRIMTSSSDGKVAMLLLFSISVATLGAILGGSNQWKTLFKRAFLISLAMCFPIPLAVDFILLWKIGYDIFDLRNFPFHVALCAVWSVEATVAGWLLALGFTLYRGRHINNRRLS